MKKTYQVFVRADGQGRVVEIASSAYKPNEEGFVRIDEGTGDRFKHAQGNYLPDGLTDERGMARYALSDGKLIRRSQEEMDEDYAAQLAADGRELSAQEALDIILGGE